MVTMMNKTVFIGFASLLTGCMIANARTAHTGHLFVALTDRETGAPITNATVTVRAQTKFSLSHTLESFFTKTSAMSDSNGIAHVEFLFYDPDFSWHVYSPGHYNGIFGPGHGEEEFGCVVEESDYSNIDTNTVQGLAMYNELVQLATNNDYLGFATKFNPKSVTYTNNVIHRSVCLTPKHNPQPMHAYYGSDRARMSKKMFSSLLTNGVEITRYKPIDFDMKIGLAVSHDPNHDDRLDGPAGKVADFHLERFHVVTNGVETNYGWIDFAHGCGAYKRITTGDPTFPMTYEADTNAVLQSRIAFEYSSISGSVIHAVNLLERNEYMVLKTRVETNEVGVVTNCNYAKILGPMMVNDELCFTALIFNPRTNDTNLEFDLENNLDIKDPCNLYP